MLAVMSISAVLLAVTEPEPVSVASSCASPAAVAVMPPDPVSVATSVARACVVADDTPPEPDSAAAMETISPSTALDTPPLPISVAPRFCPDCIELVTPPAPVMLLREAMTPAAEGNAHDTGCVDPSGSPTATP